MIEDPVLHEVFEQWPAWQTIVERLLPVGTDAREVPVSAVEEAIGGMNGGDLRRLAHAFVANGHSHTLADAVILTGEVWGMAMRGQRPRFGAEVGLSSADFPEREL